MQPHTSLSSHPTLAPTLACLSTLLLVAVPTLGADKPSTKTPVLKHSEIVFMFVGNNEEYKAYGATFVAWGGATDAKQVHRHRDQGIRCTGHMWCLTAGPKLTHEDPKIRAACAVDIEGKPVEVPWQFDNTYKGTKTYFGCTNNPDYRELLRNRVRDVMKGKPDGLHIDDHLGAAAAAWHHAGGMCDHCMAAFRTYLKTHATPQELQAAGVNDLNTFDYRNLVRKYATTRAECRNWKTQQKIPLWSTFKQFHLHAAAENVRELGKLAEEVAGHPVTLSANAGISHEPHRYVVKYLTHVICEVPQRASAGTARPEEALTAYRLATEYGKPLAATASGQDWAFAKANACDDLVRSWIALAYAHGQRFMTPHPRRQWCFTKELGTHWYEAPVEAFAPVYQFIKRNADCFDGLEAVEVKGLAQPAKAILTVRRNAQTGRTVIHVLNRDYDPATKKMRTRENVVVRIPVSPGEKTPGKIQLLAYDAEAVEVPVNPVRGAAQITLPSLHLWTIVVLK